MFVRVYYEDTDAGGIVYHTNYIKYCERARSEKFFKKSIMPIGEQGSSFVIRHIDANFLGMAYLGDMLEIQTKPIKKRHTSMVLKHSIFNKNEKIFEMEVLLVFIKEGKPSRIPQYILEVLIPKNNE